MDFRLLGPLEVLDGERRIPLGGPKQRAVLAYLLTHANRVVSPDRLIDEVWGESAAYAARNTLQSHISHLRRALGPTRIATRPAGYLLEVDPEEVDALRFERLVSEARPRLSADPEAAAAMLEEALSLWRGSPLADLADEPSLAGEIARFEELRLSAIEDRMAAELAAGRHREVVPELEALVAANPLRERVWAHLMLALYRGGRQAEALSAFGRARKVLAEEIGIDPSMALTRLQEQILAQDPTLDLPPPGEHVGEAANGATPIVAVSVEAGAARPAEERKVVTVLFVDLVESTTPSDGVDPEDALAALRPYHVLMRREIERLGGTVEKFIGDAVMAVFGAPVTHEDDAERAVRAALRIVEVISELNAERLGLDLAVRAAVSTGEAVVNLGARLERGEGIAAGDVVNTASRLQLVALWGDVVVDEVTYRATGGVIDYEELEPARVKGKPQPLPIWRAVEARSRYAVEVGKAPTPFIGREEDLALLQQTYARMLRESSIQLVTMTGEPGVGKSRLIAEFFCWADDRPEVFFWRRGRCLPYGEGITFWALGEIVKTQAGILESDGPVEAAAKLEEAVDLVVEDASERPWLKARLAALVGTEPGSGGIAERAESFAAWRLFLEALAAHRPLILVIEDLHWADDAMLDFIEHVVDWVAGVPMLVLCSARPELYERRPAWGGGKRNSTAISLSPLSPNETAKLVSALLPEAVLPAENQATLLERSGGNPLYAEEFARMLVDRGILERSDKGWRIGAGSDIPVPETVQAIIAARIDTLPPEGKALLHNASVVGKVFWSRALAFMTGLEERTVIEGLHVLARKELVRPARRSSMEGQAEYAFWHTLVREVAYGQIARRFRAAKHRSVAEWIEQTAGDRVADHAELIAHHLAQALELARAGSEDVGALEEAARRALVLAGDRAARLDVGRAESYYRRALELLPPGQPARGEALTKVGDMAFQMGRLEEAKQAYAEAIAESRARVRHIRTGQAMVKLAFTLRDLGEVASARSYLAQAVQLLEREPPGPELVLAYTHTARDHIFSGRYRDCLEWSARAIALARDLGIEGQAMRALQYLGSARFDSGDVDGIEDVREALRMGLDLGLGEETAVAYINLGELVWFTEGPAQALEIYETGIDFTERRGITFRAMWLKAQAVWALFELGRWGEVTRTTDEVIEWERTRGGSQVGTIALPFKARVLMWRNALTEAASLMEETLARARDIGDPHVLAPALASAALVQQARGETSDAVRLIEELEAGTPDRSIERVRCSLDALRVCLAAGEIDVAKAMLQGSTAETARSRLSAITGRAILAEDRREFDDATGLYLEAEEGWRVYGHTFERGQALLGAGRCLLGHERAYEATKTLKVARGVFEWLGAPRLVAEADRLLERAQKDARPRPGG